MERLSIKDGFSIGLMLTGWSVYSLISREAPHLLYVAIFAGVVAGVGMGIGFWKFLDHPNMAPYKSDFLARRTTILLVSLFCIPLFTMVILLFDLNMVTRMFFIGMIIAMFITNIFSFTKLQNR